MPYYLFAEACFRLWPKLAYLCSQSEALRQGAEVQKLTPLPEFVASCWFGSSNPDRGFFLVKLSMGTVKGLKSIFNAAYPEGGTKVSE